MSLIKDTGDLQTWSSLSFKSIIIENKWNRHWLPVFYSDFCVALSNKIQMLSEALQMSETFEKLNYVTRHLNRILNY